MFCINKEQQLTPELLFKMLNKFNLNVAPRLNKYKNYYDGIQAISRKQYEDASKPCNRACTNFAKNITDSYCGYLASGGFISYTSDEDIEDIMEVLNYNDYQCEDSEFLLNALIYGVSHELMYYDEEAKLRFRLINPQNSFGVFDDSLSNDLLYFVRWYKANEWDNNTKYNLDVYDDTNIYHYTMSGSFGTPEYVGVDAHNLGQCPANIFMLEGEKSIFDSIIDLQDSYNEIYTSSIDDYNSFVDAFLVLQGVDADEEDIATMKENRVLVLPEGATANWLTKNSNDGGVEAKLKRTQESIYRIAQCPDFSAESFVGGVSSGIAIRYRLTGMETRAAKIEAVMKKALQRRIEIICGASTMRLGEEVFRDININFTRNMPSDNSDILNTVKSLQGIVSDETLLSFIPQINNPQEELERVQNQRQESIALYSFGNTEKPVEDNE